MIKKKQVPIKQELQEEFHTYMSFEEAMRKILNVPKEDVEKAIESEYEELKESHELQLEEDE